MFTRQSSNLAQPTIITDHGNHESKYHWNSISNRQFLHNQTRQLLDFGQHFPAPLGGSGWLDNNGNLDPSQGIHTWITARMAHTYAIGEMLQYPHAYNLVERALDGLLGILRDYEYGGWYPQVSWDGVPQPGKLCYTHAFVILAASSALLAGHQRARSLLDDALNIFEEKFWDDTNQLTYDTWNTQWSLLENYRGLNANMHTVEAFLAVADSTNNELYRKRAGMIIDYVIEWSKHNHWRIPEHFDQNWNPDLTYNAHQKHDQFKPYGATPGHGIEWARLIIQWALSTYKHDHQQCETYISAAEQLFARAIEDGWYVDNAPGIVYTTDWNGQPIVHDRMHWTLAEALNTSAVLYKVTSRPIYQNNYATYCEYIDTYIIDHKQGSWLHQLDQNNIPISTIWPGKSDLYHAFQATLIPLYDPATSIASAIYQNTQQCKSK